MRGRLCNPRQGIRGKQLPFPTPLSISSAFVLHGAPPPSFQHSPSKNLALRFGSSFLLPKSAGGGGDIGIRSLSSVKPCARATDRDRTIDGHGHSSSLGGEKHDEEREEREKERKRARDARYREQQNAFSHKTEKSGGGGGRVRRALLPLSVSLAAAAASTPSSLTEQSQLTLTWCLSLSPYSLWRSEGVPGMQLWIGPGSVQQTW